MTAPPAPAAGEALTLSLREIVHELEAHGRLPLAVAMRPELLAEAWWTCVSWLPMFGLAQVVDGCATGEWTTAVARTVRHNGWETPQWQACDAIRAAVPCPTVEQVVAALTARVVTP